MLFLCLYYTLLHTLAKAKDHGTFVGAGGGGGQILEADTRGNCTVFAPYGVRPFEFEHGLVGSNSKSVGANTV